VTEPDPALCAVCQRPGRVPNRPMVCDGDRFGIDDDLRAIPGLCALLDPERLSVADGPKVSGSREAPVPNRVDGVDLTLPSRMAARALVARGLLGLDPDQVGHLPVATILETIVRDWIRQPWCRVTLAPKPDVTSLCEWLRTHLDDACDWHEDIADHAAEVRALRRTLLAALGRSQRSGDYIGRCPTMLREGRCDTRLYADPYVDHIACPKCRVSWPRHRWLRLAAEQQDARESA
jgi:hypothetical protein